MKKQRLRSREPRFTAVGTRRNDHPTPISPQTLALKFADRQRSSVGIVRFRTESHGVCLSLQGKNIDLGCLRTGC
jgi:hypothetical protein